MELPYYLILNILSNFLVDLRDILEEIIKF